MKTIYVTSDRLGAERLQQQLAAFSPSTHLLVSDRVDEAHRRLASDVVDAVLIDTGLSEANTAGLLADIRHRRLPLVVIVAAASAVRSNAFWALQADYVWAYDAHTGYPHSPERFARDVSMAIRQAIGRCLGEKAPAREPMRMVYVGGDADIASTGAVSDITADRLLVEESAEPPGSSLDAGTRDLQRPVQRNAGVDVREAGGGATGGWSTPLPGFSPDHLEELATREAQCIELQRRVDQAGARAAELSSTLEAERAEWRTRLDALTVQQRQDAADHQARRDELQRALDEARAERARVAALAEDERAGWRARLEALTVHQQQELARERTEREEMAHRLRVAQDELRRKARLSGLTSGVVTELDSFIGDLAAQTARAAEDAPPGSPLGLQLERARRTAGRAQDLARRFLTFCRGQAGPPELTDLNTVILDFAATLQGLVGSHSELLLRIEPTAALVSLGREQIRRLLFACAVLCGDALPIGGQVIVETESVETIPSWDTRAPHAEPLPFVRLTVTAVGHAPTSVRVTPALESIAQECDGHCGEVSTDEPSTGLSIHLPRIAEAQQG